MLNNQQIQQIVDVLKLEKITVLQKITLVCVPTIQDEDFRNKFNDVEKKLKKISPIIELSICSDAEIDTIRALPPVTS